MKVVKIRPGRPRKFDRPSRAVTLTLPEDVIGALEAIDKDLSHAVVRLAVPVSAEVLARAPAELAKYEDCAVIIVKRVAAFGQIPGVTLVPLPDGRALISLDEGMNLFEFELKLRDMIEAPPQGDAEERQTLASIAEILKSARRTRGISLNRRSIIVLQSTSHRRRIVS
jgi:hypothetical protein